jgi:hypothetical protein
MKLFALSVVIVFLFGCASLENHPKEGLVEVKIQQLEKTNTCTGKGVKAYSAFKGREYFPVKVNTVYVSPGTWSFSYFPHYESGTPENCEEIEEIIIHGEFSVSGKLKKGKKYLLKLNAENQAEFKVM